MDRAFEIEAGSGRVIATAIHAGHELRPEIKALTALDDLERLREEDPYTDLALVISPNRVRVHRSRFEVDLNRPEHQAFYRDGDDAWGLELWREQPEEEVVGRSLEIHRGFYAAMRDLLDERSLDGPFVVYDIHSYNHRRSAPDAPDEPAEANPEINVGTGSMDRLRWGGVVGAFMSAIADRVIDERRIDVRENIRFRGGYLSRWVHEQYPEAGCALAIEIKKTFMDEWTGELDSARLDVLIDALATSVGPVTRSLESV